MRAVRSAFGMMLAGALALTFASSGHSQTWKPDRNIEIVVPTAAGGGNDKTARLLGKLLQDKGIGNIVVNKTGASGALAYHYIIQRRSDPYTIGIAQAGLLSNQITGRSPFGYADLTILANVGFEPSSLAVRPDSPLKDPRALFVTSDTRLSGEFSQVPTLRESGIDVVAMGWTAIIAPPGLTPALIAGWEETLAELTKTEEWRKYLAFNYWQNVYQGHVQASAHLKAQYEQARSGLVDLGLAK